MIARLTVLVFLLGLSFVLSQELLYEPYIVPRLATWNEVPYLLWVGTLAPEFAVCVAAALISRSTKEWLSFCFLGGLVITALQWVAGLLNQPGHIKAIEGGIVNFVLQYAILTVLLLITVGVMRLIRYSFRSRGTVS